MPWWLVNLRRISPHDCHLLLATAHNPSSQGLLDDHLLPLGLGRELAVPGRNHGGTPFDRSALAVEEISSGFLARGKNAVGLRWFITALAVSSLPDPPCLTPTNTDHLLAATTHRW